MKIIETFICLEKRMDFGEETQNFIKVHRCEHDRYVKEESTSKGTKFKIISTPEWNEIWKNTQEQIKDK